jgi:hypothetical protein
MVLMVELAVKVEMAALDNRVVQDVVLTHVKIVEKKLSLVELVEEVQEAVVLVEEYFELEMQSIIYQEH